MNYREDFYKVLKEENVFNDKDLQFIIDFQNKEFIKKRKSSTIEKICNDNNIKYNVDAFNDALKIQIREFSKKLNKNVSSTTINNSVSCPDSVKEICEENGIDFYLEPLTDIEQKKLNAINNRIKPFKSKLKNEKSIVKKIGDESNLNESNTVDIKDLLLQYKETVAKVKANNIKLQARKLWS